MQYIISDVIIMTCEYGQSSDTIKVCVKNVFEGRRKLKMDIIRELENEQLKSEITPFNVGDTVRVHAKVVEGTRERIQTFEGVVIKR